MSRFYVRLPEICRVFQYKRKEKSVTIILESPFNEDSIVLAMTSVQYRNYDDQSYEASIKTELK